MRVAVRPQKIVGQAVKKILEKFSNKCWLVVGLLVVFRTQIFRRATVRWAWVALLDAVNGGGNGGLNGALMSVSKCNSWLVHDNRIQLATTQQSYTNNAINKQKDLPIIGNFLIQNFQCIWQILDLLRCTYEYRWCKDLLIQRNH